MSSVTDYYGSELQNFLTHVNLAPRDRVSSARSGIISSPLSGEVMDERSDPDFASGTVLCPLLSRCEVGFPLAVLLFVPVALCSPAWLFLTKCDLATGLVRGLCWPAPPVVVVADNL